jgi:uncharacterized GH25 family protein/ketosteroid isomerase-like protein
MTITKITSALRILGIAGVTLVATAAVALAHDFWIVPLFFQVAPGDAVEVMGQTGVRFPESQSAVSADRVAEARLIGAEDDERITDVSIREKSLLLRHRPSAAGQRVVAVALVPRTTRATPASLKRYIALEGAPELAQRYERDGVFPTSDSVTQRSVKFAKSITEVGERGPRAFSRTAGHLLELVPANDPSSLRVGETLRVRLVYRGQPLGNAYMRAGTASIAGVASDGVASGDTTIVTGVDGVARLPVRRGGLWNVRTLHAAPFQNEWEVLFATLVFQMPMTGAAMMNPPVAAGAPATARAARDSVAVREVVEAFHGALARGDSAGALALLASDVMVLESGDAETREEYRAHHLSADIGFARATSTTRAVSRVVVLDAAAWLTAASVTRGTYRDRPINSRGVELVVLSREAGGWKIRAVHWSSQRR